MRDYTKIHACKLADDLAVDVYQLTRKFPDHERYGLTSQLRRAAVSVPSNIAEGSARESKKDYLHFLYIARASLTETQYLLHLSNRLELVSNPDAEDLAKRSRQVYACLFGLIKAVEKEAGLLGRLAAVSSSLVAVWLAH